MILLNCRKNWKKCLIVTQNHMKHTKEIEHFFGYHSSDELSSKLRSETKSWIYLCHPSMLLSYVNSRRKVKFNTKNWERVFLWTFNEFFYEIVAGSWRLEDLSQKIQVPASVVRKKIAYWQAQGLIEEISSDQFTLIENIEQHSRPDSGNSMNFS